MKLTHIDLFSGIGGFSLALDNIYGKENVRHTFCEIDPFCQAVLKKHWPKAQIYGDIKELTGLQVFETMDVNEKLRRSKEDVRVRDVHSGGGNLLQDNQTSDVGGSTEERSEDALKPALRRAESLSSRGQDAERPREQYGGVRSAKGSIETTRIMRNLQGSRKFEGDTSASSRLQQATRRDMAVPAVSSRVAQKEQGNKTEIKYEIFLLTAGTPCQPASQAGRRKGTNDDRWLWPETFRIIRETKPNWCILENVRGLLSLEQGVVFQNLLSELEDCGYEVRVFIIPACAVGAPHRRDRVWFVAHRESEFRNTPRLSSRTKQKDSRFGKSDEDESRNTSWQRHWLEVATRLCRMDDGLPERMVRLPDGTKISQPRWRREALKAYGNSVVPPLVVKIVKAIKAVDDGNARGVY